MLLHIHTFSYVSGTTTTRATTVCFLSPRAAQALTVSPVSTSRARLCVTCKRRKQHKTNTVYILAQVPRPCKAWPKAKVVCIASGFSQSGNMNFVCTLTCRSKAGKPPRSPRDWVVQVLRHELLKSVQQQWLPQRMPEMTRRVRPSRRDQRSERAANRVDEGVGQGGGTGEGVGTVSTDGEEARRVFTARSFRHGASVSCSDYFVVHRAVACQILEVRVLWESGISPAPFSTGETDALL